MNQKNQPIRQGDILLVPVDIEPPTDAAVTTRVVLGEGETPGHMHVLEAQRVVTWGDLLRVEGDAPGTITHPEHDPTPAPVIEPGVTYKVVHQREHTLDGMWAPVRD